MLVRPQILDERLSASTGVQSRPFLFDSRLAILESQSACRNGSIRDFLRVDRRSIESAT